MALTQVKGSILSDELYRRENNLNDVLDKAIARNNLSVYSKTESDGRYLDEAANLSDLPSTTTARSNLDVYSKSEVNSKIDNIPPPVQAIWVGEIRRFSLHTPPPGFFSLDGSTIPNGKIDFTALANSGSAFITIEGNNIRLLDFQHFGRGKGASGRGIGAFEADAIRNIYGEIHNLQAGISNRIYCNGPFTEALTQSRGNTNEGGAGQSNVYFNASIAVPTAHENRPMSYTELVCIYHGVI